METWQTALLTASLSVLTAIITTRVTAWSSHKNEVKKWLLEKRTQIYFSFYDQVELALKERKKVFEQEYLDSLISLKPQMKLMSSKRTFKVFHSYYEFIQDNVSAYKKFCADNDPRCDSSRFCQIISDDGKEYEVYDITQWDIDHFEWQEEKYKQDNLPDNNKMNSYIEPLYQAMRKDLGSDI